MQTLDDVRKFI